jgi:hypothetical protein
MAKLSIKRISDFIRRTVEESSIAKFALRKVIEARIRPLFNQIRQEMLDEFTNHPVTEELDMGPKLNWGSKFLDGYGDLYSFIGFNRDDDPTRQIKELIKGLRLYSVTSKGLDHVFEIRNFPTKQDVASVTPMPWASGRSWAIGIEEGISGLGKYLNTEYQQGRSGAGIQLKNVKNLRGAFKPTPYINTILKKYRAKFSELSKVKLLGIKK